MTSGESPVGDSGECSIPPPVDPEALERYSLEQEPSAGADAIREYVEWQSPEEEVTHLECVLTERVVGRNHEIWDVHTTGERYWVITNPTNLYSQRLFPSADYTLTFHVGLAMRIASRRDARADEQDRERTLSAWRAWTQAGEALDRAHEAEEFQAVGMRCRECLLMLVRSIADDSMVPSGKDAPKVGDFIHWSEFLAEALAGGSASKEVRSYLKSVARSSWQLVSWLVHAANASRFDAELAFEATHSTLVAFNGALLRFDRGRPPRCAACGSYRLAHRFAADMGSEGGYVTMCEACGWIRPEGGSQPEHGNERLV